MKKYIKPEMTVYEMEPTLILAGSVNVDETELVDGVGESQ